MKKTKNQKRQENLQRFREEILPALQEKYEVQSHGPYNAPASMYKIIITGNKSYDYYPMAEKMRINIGENYEWKSVSLEQMANALNQISFTDDKNM